jgi:hypothetical protein
MVAMKWAEGIERQVRANLTAQHSLLEETGASYLSAQDLRNAGVKHRMRIPMLIVLSGL